MSKLKLHWLTARKATQTAVSFGTPWSQGALLPGEAVLLQDEAGTGVPVQTRINAYWPDGSVKWLLHSGVLDTRQTYSVSKGENARPAATATLSASQSPDGSVTVESSLLSCRVAPGSTLISSILRKQTSHKPVSAQLTALIENRDEQEGIETISIHKLNGVTEKITLEEAGPLRAVVKLEGRHRYTNREISRFPFVIRLYFYAGSDEIRMVHSFAFDADEHTDYLKGLAVHFQMEAEGELWNRHVGFAGDTGMFYEAVQPMYTYSGAVHPVYEQQQIAGQFVPVQEVEEAGLLENVRDNAAWGISACSRIRVTITVLSKAQTASAPTFLPPRGTALWVPPSSEVRALF